MGSTLLKILHFTEIPPHFCKIPPHYCEIPQYYCKIPSHYCKITPNYCENPFTLLSNLHTSAKIPHWTRTHLSHYCNNTYAGGRGETLLLKFPVYQMTREKIIEQMENQQKEIKPNWKSQLRGFDNQQRSKIERPRSCITWESFPVTLSTSFP